MAFWIWMIGFLPMAETDAFEIDPVHHFIGFTVQHFSVGKVRARFNEAKGNVHFNPDDLGGFQMRIALKAASIDTGSEERDKGLAGPFWLNAEAFPEITFSATQLEKGDDGYRVTGEFAMKGHTKTKTFPVKIKGPVADPLGMERLGVEAYFVVNRQDFGMPFDRTMKDGGPFVGNELHVEVVFEAIRKSSQ